ncbi:MAG: recombination protein RecR [Candidatus Yonathbacteria bacterium]|nr:recombination protein RecR [Candidatus Yonathbacteria bacterium]
MPRIDNLTSLFMKFPGIGTRQSKRFVYFLLAQNPHFVEQLAYEISILQKSITRCGECFRFYTNNGKLSENNVCDICVNDTDNTTILVVEKDTDFESVKRSGNYTGKYFILGGTIPVLTPDPTTKIRINELIARIKKGAPEGLQEIILALSSNPESDFTREYIIKTITPTTKELGIIITSLGRGLSTGTELEYSDRDTIHHALKNRR